MAVRSKRLTWGGPLAAGTHNIYQVPAGETALIKHVVLGNQGTGQATVSLRIGGTTDAFNHRKEVLGAGTYAAFDTWYAVPAGALCSVHVVGASASVYVFLYGAELEGVAD